MCPCELLSAAITLAECKQSKDKMTHSNIFNFKNLEYIYILCVQRELEQTWNRSPPRRDSVMGSCVGETWAHQDGAVYSLTVICSSFLAVTLISNLDPAICTVCMTCGPRGCHVTM